MDTTQIVSLSTAFAIALGSLLAYFKYRPGQKETTQASVAESTLNIAQGTIKLVTDELEEQFKRMSAEQREQREIHAKEIAGERAAAAELRHELDEALKEVRNLKKALTEAWAEVETCKKRCVRLEEKLTRLTGATE